jgi:hypothetical protein
MTKVNFSFQSINSCSSEVSQNLAVVHLILFADIPIAGNVKIYLKDLRKATRNFCPGNKLGQGSFGPVYLVGCSIISDVALFRYQPNYVPDWNTGISEEFAGILGTLICWNMRPFYELMF